MRIGIDARTILNPQKNPAIGVGHYTYQLIRHLLKLDQRNQYALFFDYRVREKDVKKFSRPNVKMKYFPWSDYKKYLPGAYSEILGLATISRGGFDVLHTTSPDARIPLGYWGKVVCTFQDLAVYKHPQLFYKLKRIKARYNRKAMAKRADRVIAVSENTKKDLMEIFNISSQKIFVVRNGVDERFFNETKGNPQKIKEELEEKFKINRPYLLFIGTLEPIKNITRLLQAFQLFQQKKRGYQLVLVGKRGWLASQYLQIAKDLNVAEQVRFLGYVEGDDLRKLLSQTELFVMPSLYEGFGMSVLEAMASGAPCLISELASLREIAEEAAEYVNPYDTKEISKKMEMLIEDKTKREKLIIKGKEQASKFSWEKCARETLEVYRKISQEA